MKTFNFWRTLVCTVMAVAAFTACSDDDDEKGFSGEPSITVNGASSAAVATDLDGGDTQAVEVVSAGPWTLSFDTAGADTWCTPSAMSSKGGTTMLKFNLGQTTAEREATVKLTATGQIAGYPITRTATITVKQNQGGSVVGDTNIAQIRTLLKAMNPGETKTTVTDEIAAMTIKGVVVSVFSGHNFGNDYNIAVQDANNAPNSGLTLNANKFKDLAIPAGSIVTIPLTAAQVNTYNGVLQLAIDNGVTISTEAGTGEPTPIEITLEQVPNYESQYVKIQEVCQPDASFIGKAWNTGSYNTGGNSGNVDFVTVDGNKPFVVRAGSAAVFKNELVPNKRGHIQGIAGVYIKGSDNDLQILPRDAEDLAGLNEDIPAPDYTKATINEIDKAGNFEVEATIVGVHQKGVMFADNAGGKNNFILAFNNEWTTQTANPYKGNVNYKATVKGTVKDQYGLWQFNAPEITVGAENTFDLGTPATFDATAIDAYAKAIVADQNASEYKYVKLSGVLTIKAESTYNSYTLAVTGLSDEVVKTITMAYGFDSYYNGIVSGDVVDVEGFALGFDTSKGNLNIMVTKVAKNTSTPAVTIKTVPTAFAAAGDAEGQEIAFTVANEANNKVFAKIEGADAGQFAVPAGEITGTSVKVTAKENTAETAKTAKLVIYLAAAEGAAAVASDEVELVQSRKSSGTELTVTVDFAANSYDIPTKESDVEAAFTVGTYDFIYRNAKYYTNDKYLMLAAKSLDNSYITCPAIAGKTLVKVVATNRKGAAKAAAIAIVPTDSTTPVGGGASQKWTDPLPADGASDITFNLSGTAANTAYRIYAIKGNNAQLTKLVLTYE
ncbi:DUF5689 domain-containing protein [Alistipes sp.]|uniref:DUF5689 domain-containing protein n=1 Tax=Alistipes sp. TaxID=1872444 RepID=UPI003AB586F4